MSDESDGIKALRVMQIYELHNEDDLFRLMNTPIDLLEDEDKAALTRAAACVNMGLANLEEEIAFEREGREAILMKNNLEKIYKSREEEASSNGNKS